MARFLTKPPSRGLSGIEGFLVSAWGGLSGGSPCAAFTGRTGIVKQTSDVEALKGLCGCGLPVIVDDLCLDCYSREWDEEIDRVADRMARK